MRLQTLFFLFLMSSLSFAKSFEGRLKYSTSIEVSDKLQKMGITKEILLDKMKKEGSLADSICIYYHEGNYYNLLQSTKRFWSIYKAETNKIYTFQDGESSDLCTVLDASVDLETVLTGKKPIIEQLDTTVRIFNVDCKVVRVKWKTGTYDYYYNSTVLSVDPSLYSNHIYDGWADFLKISNSLPIQIVKTVKGMMTVTLTLVSFNDEIIDDKMFSIPELKKDDDMNLVKMPGKEILRIKK